MIDFLMVSLTNGILITLLIIVLILFCLYIYTDNQKLKQQNEELRKENRSLLETKIIKQDNIDSISIKSISNEQMPSNYNKIDHPTNLVKETKPSCDITSSSKEEVKEQDDITKNDNYSTKKDNDLENINYNDTSFLETTNIKTEEEIILNKENSLIDKLIASINTNEISSIDNNTSNKTNDYSYYNINEITTNNISKDFNINELIYKNNANKINEQIRVQEEYDYLKDISSKIVEELKPQTIKLTDYEQKQEDQAVISYKELLRIKDNNYITDEKQDTIKFIEELKNLRNSLK